MADEPWATRRELDLLREDFRDLRNEVQPIVSGASGVPVLQDRMIELVKDVGDLRLDMNQRFTDHLKAHEQANRDRVSGRRWLIGISFTALGALCGLYVMIFDLLSRH